MIDIDDFFLGLMGLLGISFVVVMILILTGVIHKDHNQDPRKGSVSVSDQVTKQCNGKNLIFHTDGGLFSDGSVAIVANSPECK